MGANRTITELNAVTSLSGTDYITAVVGGVNVKMTVANFIAVLGVTGTIVQDGAVTGTPILDVDGTINNIRNIEAGNGILASVSPENGVTLAHNFDADATGLPLLLNANTASPDIASLVAGEGVELTATGNSIKIVFTGIPVDVVVVTELADLPTPVAGVITLLADTGYQISGTVALGANRIVGSGGTVIFGSDASISSLTYTGTGVMFTSAVGNFKLRDLTAECEDGTLFGISSAGDGIFQLINCTFPECDEIGDVSNLLAIQFVSVGFNDVKTDGLVFAGTIGAMATVRSLFTVNGGSCFDLGSCTIAAGWSAETSFATLATGTSFLKGLASSGNIAAGALGTVLNMRFSGLGDPLDTITHDDIRWQFLGNDDIPDSRPDALISLQGPEIIAITTVDTPVVVGAGWTVQSASQFTITTGGRATYNGVKSARFPIMANLACEPTSGTNKDYTFYVAINGAIIANSAAGTTVTAGGPKNTAVMWQYDFDPGDYVEIWIENTTDAQDVSINNAVLVVN